MTLILILIVAGCQTCPAFVLGHLFWLDRCGLVGAGRLKELMSEAAVGIHTMWCAQPAPLASSGLFPLLALTVLALTVRFVRNEHFGIGVVEMMAAVAAEAPWRNPTIAAVKPPVAAAVGPAAVAASRCAPSKSRPNCAHRRVRNNLSEI